MVIFPRQIGAREQKCLENSRIDSSEVTVQKSSCRLSIKSKSWLLRYLLKIHRARTVKIAGTCTRTQTVHITHKMSGCSGYIRGKAAMP